MNASGKFISPQKASEILQVTKQTLVNWENSGKIKAYRTKMNVHFNAKAQRLIGYGFYDTFKKQKILLNQDL